MLILPAQGVLFRHGPMKGMAMNGERIDQDVQFAGEAVPLAEFMTSGLFQRTYQEGMQLVEETSAYLDGPGREASRNLSREASLAYAGESMRLTTRLMQVAAWLLVRKAVHEGEITHEEAQAEKYRLATKEIARSARLAGADSLPERLRELIGQSERLYARVERLDSRLREHQGPVAAHHPMAEQLSRVEAFYRETLARNFGEA